MNHLKKEPCWALLSLSLSKFADDTELDVSWLGMLVKYLDSLKDPCYVKTSESSIKNFKQVWWYRNCLDANNICLNEMTTSRNVFQLYVTDQHIASELSSVLFSTLLIDVEIYLSYWLNVVCW